MHIHMAYCYIHMHCTCTVVHILLLHMMQELVSQARSVRVHAHLYVYISIPICTWWKGSGTFFRELWKTGSHPGCTCICGVQRVYMYMYTVEPPNNGRIGSRPFVRCREVSLSGRLAHNLVLPLSTIYQLLLKHFSGHNNLAWAIWVRFNIDATP